MDNIPANASIKSDITVLQDIHLNSKNIAIYRRDLGFLENPLDPTIQKPIDFGINGTKEEIATALRAYFDKELSESEILLNDVLDLLEVFSKVTKGSSFRILFASIHTNMCTRFHSDNNKLRLLCTYVGPGTLWLPDNGIDRDAYLCRKGNQDIVRDENDIQQLAPGDVAILKGTQYPSLNPVLHRSPGIEERGEQRLLLRIDI